MSFPLQARLQCGSPELKDPITTDFLRKETTHLQISLTPKIELINIQLKSPLSDNPTKIKDFILFLNYFIKSL